MRERYTKIPKRKKKKSLDTTGGEESNTSSEEAVPSSRSSTGKVRLSVSDVEQNAIPSSKIEPRLNIITELSSVDKMSDSLSNSGEHTLTAEERADLLARVERVVNAPLEQDISPAELNKPLTKKPLPAPLTDSETMSSYQRYIQQRTKDEMEKKLKEMEEKVAEQRRTNISLLFAGGAAILFGLWWYNRRNKDNVNQKKRLSRSKASFDSKKNNDHGWSKESIENHDYDAGKKVHTISYERSEGSEEVPETKIIPSSTSVHTSTASSEFDAKSPVFVSAFNAVQKDKELLNSASAIPSDPFSQKQEESSASDHAFHSRPPEEENLESSSHPSVKSNDFPVENREHESVEEETLQDNTLPKGLTEPVINGVETEEPLTPPLVVADEKNDNPFASYAESAAQDKLEPPVHSSFPAEDQEHEHNEGLSSVQNNYGSILAQGQSVADQATKYLHAQQPDVAFSYLESSIEWLPAAPQPWLLLLDLYAREYDKKPDLFEKIHEKFKEFFKGVEDFSYEDLLTQPEISEQEPHYSALEKCAPLLLSQIMSDWSQPQRVQQQLEHTIIKDLQLPNERFTFDAIQELLFLYNLAIEKNTNA